MNCSEANCTRKHKARGLCAKHYQHALEKGYLTKHTRVRDHPIDNGVSCKVGGCLKPYYRYGWCYGHSPKSEGLRCKLCQCVQALAVCRGCSKFLERYEKIRGYGVRLETLERARDMVMVKGTLGGWDGDQSRAPV